MTLHYYKMLANLGLDRYGVTTGSQRQYLYLQSPEDPLGVLLIQIQHFNSIEEFVIWYNTKRPYMSLNWD
jgi:hypothetical protein